jgi:glycosyltransferase 2 family protein
MPKSWDYPHVSESQTTLVIEDGVIPRRVRRPVDLLRFATALLVIAAILAAATILLGTVSGIDADVADSARRLPAGLAILLSAIAGFGQLVLPATVAIDLLAKRRLVLLLEATFSATVAAGALIAIIALTRNFGSDDLWFALAGTTERTAVPLQPLIAAVAALLTVARMRGLAAKVAGFILISTLIADISLLGYTVAAQAISIFAGWAIGLATRYAFGTPTVRPRGITIASELSAAGFPISVLRALSSTKTGRRYMANTSDGTQLQVMVYDRDLEGAGVIPRWWRSLRIRDSEALGGWKMREAVDRAALMNHAAYTTGAAIPKLLVVRAIGEDAVIMASEWAEGTTLDKVLEDTSQVSTGIIQQIWRNVHALHSHGIAHRALTPSHFLLSTEGTIRLLSLNSGSVAMTELQRRIDVANALVTTALLSSPAAAVEQAIAQLGANQVVSAVTAIQPFALHPENRRSLKGHKKLLGEIRTLVAAAATSEAIQEVPIERLSPRKFFSIVAGLIAAYVLFGQLTQVNLLELFRSANYAYVAWGAAFSIITYIGAAMAVNGFVVEKISIVRTFLAQLASSFAALVSPPALGAVAINTRYLQKTGLSAAAAGATVAVSQVTAFIIHILLMFAAGIAAGSTQDFKFNPPQSVVFGVVGIFLLLLIILPLPAVRKYLVKIAAPRLAEILPRFVTVASNPGKMLVGIGGMFLLNIAFCLTLIASVRAFDGGGSIAAISLVYLAGSTLGQAAPTPGGVGAVETVMTAGLIASGIDGGIALSAVLLYRLLTFWIPTIPGWFAFQYLTKKDAL